MLSDFLGNVRYDEDGVPRLTADDLERIALNVGRDFEPAHPTRPERLQVATFLTALQDLHGATVEFCDLSERSQQRRVLGVTHLRAGTIQIDTGLTADENAALFHFTAAHEVGHWVLHRSRKITEGESSQVLDEIADDKEHFRIREKGVVDSPRGWMEYHANRFAAFLLMPRVAFSRALEEVQTDLGIMQHQGTVWVTQANPKEVQATVEKLGERFGTSPTTTWYHLDNLGLLRNTVKPERPTKPFAFPS